MKKIEVLVRDKNTLILEEAAQKGDYIDLSMISNVDFTQIERVILEGKDTIYNQKLEEFAERQKLKFSQDLQAKETDFILEKRKLLSEMDDLKKDYQMRLEREQQESSYKHQLEVNALQAQIEALNEKIATEVNQVKKNEETKYNEKIQSLTLELERQQASSVALAKDVEYKHQLKVQELEQALQSINNSLEDKIKKEHLETERSYTEKVSSLNQKINDLVREKESIQFQQKLELEKKLNEKNEEFNKEKLQLKDQIENLTQANLLLQRQKSALNVKQTGEDLESWCDNEVRSYMQNGLEQCSWEKDNLVVRYEDEVKGSKADYIFSIFASKAKDIPLARVCLDMKDENPDSVNRKKNADYYKALDTNRRKKDCKYAVLVSNLELDKPNDIPIFKVSEYEDMYVVRPAYLMTFLNMLVSLTTRFAELVLTKEQERLELKSLLELKEDFEKLKNTYLDKPLEALSRNIDEIRKQNDKITDASRKIGEYCDTITRTYLNEIENKLTRFDLNITKAYK